MTPYKYNLSEVKDRLGEYDLFVCSASFEDRCASVAKSIDLGKIKRAIVFYTEDDSKYVCENKNRLMEIFNDKAEEVPIYHSDPIKTADAIREKIAEYTSKHSIKSVLIDITTFTHEDLLIMLYIINKIVKGLDVTYVYANASVYDPEKEQKEKWLSRGISEIRTILGYSGTISPTKKTHLIVIVGYEVERAISIINSMEPSKLSLAFGSPGNATTETDQEANLEFLKAVKEPLMEKIDVSYTDISTFEISCNNPHETYLRMNDKINEEKEYNVVIVPLNNKLSTVGVAWAAIKNEKVQVCYAQALVYNYKNYSTPGSDCYVFKIEDISTGKEQ